MYGPITGARIFPSIDDEAAEAVLLKAVAEDPNSSVLLAGVGKLICPT
jgi:hypothetical protein